VTMVMIMVMMTHQKNRNHLEKFQVHHHFDRWVSEKTNEVEKSYQR